VVRLPTPADDARLSYIQSRRPPRPTKKARGRVTPGLLGVRPGGFGVTVAEGRRPAPGAGNRPGPSPAFDCPRSSPDCVSSCPLLRPPGAEISPFCSASPSRTSSRRTHRAGGSPIRAGFFRKLPALSRPGCWPSYRPRGRCGCCGRARSAPGWSCRCSCRRLRPGV